MAIVVVGGHSRSVGKTSVVAGLVSALPELEWTAVKITQFGHGICSVDGKRCACAVDEHAWAINEERDHSGSSDTSRFLLAGARRALWVRTRQGELAEAMPDLRHHLAGARNLILESNSVLRFLHPDLYLTVLDYATADFKESAREFLEMASAIILHRPRQSMPAWKDVSLEPFAGKPVFYINPPPYVTPELVEFVRRELEPICGRERRA